MPNGKPGDHPITDILIHGHTVYSDRATQLIREVLKLSDTRQKQEISDWLMKDYDDFDDPNVAKLESELEELLAKLKSEARDRGFEV